MHRRTFIQSAITAVVTAAIPLSTMAATTAKPVIFWVTPSCPTAYTCPDTNKGEGNQGGVVHILGTNLGALADYIGATPTSKLTIGGFAPANYRFLLGARADATRSSDGGGFTDQTQSGAPGLQLLCVQVGALGNSPAGTPLNVKVTTAAGASNTLPFTPSPGSIFFVSQTGAENTAVKGDPTHPFRYLQVHGGGSGIDTQLNGANGDQIIIFAGATPWTDTSGIDGDNWWRDYAPNHVGTSQYLWGFVGYPGAINANTPDDVQYVTPAGKGGGISGPANRVNANGGYRYHVELNISCDPNANLDAAPIYHQYAWKGPMHTVSCRLGPWMSTGAAKGAGICGGTPGSISMGNEIYNMGGTTGENHGFYPSTYAHDWVVHLNYVHGIQTGSIVSENDPTQLPYGSLLPDGVTVWNGLTNMDYSFNIFNGAGKHGINRNYNTISGSAVGNVITNIVLAPFRFDLEHPHATINQVVEFNTVFNCQQQSSASDVGYVDIPGWLDTGGAGGAPVGGTIHVRHNILAAGPNTLASEPPVYINNEGVPFQFSVDLSQNIYAGWDYVTYGSGGKQGWVAGFVEPNYGNTDANGIWCDAKTGLFKNATSSPPNLHLANTSPALDAVTTTIVCTPPTLSLDFVKRPKSINYDIGALEHS